MIFKTFTFPSFEEWNKKQEYYKKIGDYTCSIKVFSCGCDKSTYIATFANSDNPTNIYVAKIFCSSISCNMSDSETLKAWYEKVTVQINDKWKDFILDTYFCK